MRVLLGTMVESTSGQNNSGDKARGQLADVRNTLKVCREQVNTFPWRLCSLSSGGLKRFHVGKWLRLWNSGWELWQDFSSLLFGREFLKRDSSLSSQGSFLIGCTTFLRWLMGLEETHGHISCRSQPAKWSLQILRCLSVTLPSFLILAIIIYSVLVSRDKINWAKKAAFFL